MKDLLMLILQIVAVACLLGVIGTLLNYFFGYSVGFKGSALPADLRATALFVVMGGAAQAIVHFWGDPKPQTSPE